jgi:hypothetical protein
VRFRAPPLHPQWLVLGPCSSPSYSTTTLSGDVTVRHASTARTDGHHTCSPRHRHLINVDVPGSSSSDWSITIVACHAVFVVAAVPVTPFGTWPLSVPLLGCFTVIAQGARCSPLVVSGFFRLGVLAAVAVAYVACVLGFVMVKSAASSFVRGASNHPLHGNAAPSMALVLMRYCAPRWRNSVISVSSLLLATGTPYCVAAATSAVSKPTTTPLVSDGNYSAHDSSCLPTPRSLLPPR